MAIFGLALKEKLRFLLVRFEMELLMCGGREGC